MATNFNITTFDYANNPHLKAKVLKIEPRIEFDPANRKHCEAVVNFLETGKWSIRLDVQGAVNVPYECLKKMAYYALSSRRVK